MHRFVLRANALFLIVAGGASLTADLAGVAFGIGPQGPLFSDAPQAAVGFIEAHGLALIFGVLLWTATPALAWHLGAAAVHLLLGVANVAFWRFFVAADMLGIGVITTALHVLFASLQIYAALLGRVPALRDLR
jgi:hypothetical protein